MLFRRVIWMLRRVVYCSGGLFAVQGGLYAVNPIQGGGKNAFGHLFR